MSYDKVAILLDFSAIRRGGGVQLASNFLDRYADSAFKRFRPLILLPGDGLLSTWTPAKDFEILDSVKVPVKLWGRWFFYRIKLQKLIWKYDIKASFTFFGPGLPCPKSVVSIVSVAYPIICYPDSPFWKYCPISEKWLIRFKNALRHRLLLRADLLLAETDVMKGRLIRHLGLSAGGVRVLPPVVTSYISDSLNASESCGTFLVLSGVAKHKNLWRLYDVAYLADKKGLNISFLLSVDKDTFWACQRNLYPIVPNIQQKYFSPMLREFLAGRGGYILHVDGTCEGDSPNLFCGLDGLSELVLDTVKISSEKKDKLVPFFRGIKKQYGKPKALVHDMGKGIVNAVEEVFPDAPDFICHFHFLRDIGKDLLTDEYTAFYKRLRKLKIRPTLRRQAKYLEQKIDPASHDIDEIIESLQSGNWQATHFNHIPIIMAYTLIHWIFDYPSQSSGYGFPFDRPHLDFYRRLEKVYQLLEQIMDINLTDSASANRPFSQLHKVVTKVVGDRRLNDLAKNLEAKVKVFDKLRCAMRIALPDGKNGINDNGDSTDMKSIEEKVIAFRKWLIGNKHRRKTYANMIAQIDKYWGKLFADPISVVTLDGVRAVQPQRTNNILERFFRDEKRRGRKKTGMYSLNKVLKTVLADTPLVQNLKNDKYMEIILDGCSSLAERFSQIDAHLVQQEMANAAKNNQKIFPAIKKMIRDVELTLKISALFCPSDAK